MKKNRIIALLLASLMCACTVTSCGNTENGKVNSGETQNTEKTDNAEGTVTAPDRMENPIGLDAYNWKYADDEVMFTIGEHPILFDEYRFSVMGYKLMTDGGDDSYWTDESQKQFKDSFISQFQMYAAIKTLANQKNITLDDADYAMIDEHIASFITQLGEEGFKNLLLQNYISEETYRRVLEYDLYSTKLSELYPATEEEIINYANENYVHVQHVLVSTVDDTNAPLDEATVAEKAKLAEEIAARAKSGEDFFGLVTEFGEDPGMNNNPEGYTFTYGEMVPEFEDKSFELEVGEVSDPVQTTYGYHIIKKLPLDVSPESEVYEMCRQNVSGSKLSAELSALSETLEIVYTDAYNELTMTNIGTLTEDAKKAAEITQKVAESTVNTDGEAAEESHEGHDHE